MPGGWHFGSKMTFFCCSTWWLTTMKFPCSHTSRLVMLVQGGDIVVIYGITYLWVMGRRFLMWGHQGILMLCHLLHNNHKFCLQLCFIISAQGIRDHRVIGASYWSCNYRRWGARSTTTIVGSCWLFYLQFERIGIVERTWGPNCIGRW
jgi:hypothetical protein